MTTLLERGLSMAARVLPAAAGGEIVYQRGEDRVWLNATWGRTEFQVDTSDGVQIEYSDRDFIVAAADLVLSGIRITPQRGDRITLVGEDQTDKQVFEVLAPGSAQPYRLCDPEGVMLRLYGKRIG